MDSPAGMADLRKQLEEMQRREAVLIAERDDAQRRLQPTTLDEYLLACHATWTRLAVQTNSDQVTKGTITNPTHKRVPDIIKPWGQAFFDEQLETLAEIYEHFPADRRQFESVDFLSTLGRRIAANPIGDEKRLEHFLKDAVETPVRNIFEGLSQIDHFKPTIPHGILFENHINNLSDRAEEPAQRRRDRTPERRPGFDRDQLRADQICVFNPLKGERRLAFVVEYKAPHKLTLPHLRIGLREMRIMDEVVSRITIPNEDPPGEEMFKYQADLFCAAAIVQTYHYMIEAGLEYSYLTTGEAFVFLKIDWANPGTLLFHLAEPRAEVGAHGDDGRYCTAVSQVLAFSLRALRAPHHDQSARNNATRHTWEQDFVDILEKIPMTERAEKGPSPAYEPRTHKDVVRSPYLFRQRKAPAVKKECQQADLKRTDSDPEIDDDDDGDDQPDDTPIRPKARHAPQKKPREEPKSRTRDRGRQYCTQKCLLGLVRNGALDAQCPNVSVHRRGTDRHPVDHATWLRLLRAQLNSDLDTDVRPLNEQGARAAAFQITLTAYGYTFIAKGTVPVFVEDLQHEAEVYRQMQPLQGHCVPVFLGAVDLKHPYYYDLGVRIGHMMFLSWAGESLLRIADDTEHKMALTDELVRSVQDVHQAGVLQADVRRPNTLWNEEVRRVFLIDFERARIAPAQKAALLVSRKRRFSQAAQDGPPEASTIMNKQMHDELCLATHVFYLEVY